MLKVIEGIGVIGIYTFFIWPITFVGGIVYAIKNVIKNESAKFNVIISAISLAIILSIIITVSL